MEEPEKLIEKLEKAFTNDPPEKFTESLGSDPGLASDILASFDTHLDDEKTDFKKGLKAVAPEFFPEEFCKYEYVACGAEDAAIRSRLIKLKTRLYYKQLKFNLLREESEGYAKTIAELFSGDKYNDPMRTLSRLQKLIGQFNLDPNRVIDLLLDCFEANPERASYYTGILNALKINQGDLSDILKRKFIYQEKVEGSAYSLCNLAAVICEQKLIDILPFFSFLEPDQKELINLWKKHTELTKSRVKRAEIINTANIDVKFVEIDEKDTKTSDNDTKNTASQPIFVALSSQLAEDEKLVDNFYDDSVTLSKNLKLGLICALLEKGDLNTALPLIEKCPQHFGLVMSPRIQQAYTALIGHSISNLYNMIASTSEFVNKSPNPTSSIKAFPFEPVNNWSEFISKTAPLIIQTGPFVGCDTFTAFKLLRVVTSFFKQMAENSSLKQFEITMMDIVDCSVLPALTLMDSNYSYSDELWELLSMFTYQQRFRLYSHWQGINTQKFLDVQRAMVLGRTKYCLKRLSKDTVKLIGRQLGKLCHIHPFAVFDYLLGQVQVYQNFITPVVESLRFLSGLELDILTFCIMESLSSPDKGQLKADDGTLSMWIIALATFIGALYKKYPSDLTGMLQFIINELKTGKSIDLLILREIVTNMSGIDANATLNENGIDALTGGEIMKQEIFHTAAVRSSKRLSARLKEALLKDDLLSALFILMAQQKACVVFTDSDKLPLKLTGQLLDQCRETFIQFNNFLQFAFKPEECAAILPPADILIKDYFLPIECSMHFWREFYMREIQTKWKQDIKKLKGDDEDAKIDDTQSLLIFSQSFNSVLESLENKLSPLKKAEFWSDITPRLYTLFWLLDLGDLQCPTSLYERLISKARSERSESAYESTSKKKTKEDKAYVLEKKLKEEQKIREQHVILIRGVFKQQSDHLITANSRSMNQMMKFLQSCLIPRAMFSEADAAFSAKFLQCLHLQKTKNLQTMLFLDKIFCEASFILSGLSEAESHAIGRFYQVLLQLSMKWHSSPTIFREECDGFPMLLKTKKTEEGEIKEDNIGYEEYRSICFKWHFRLTKTFNHILNNGSYVSKRNTLIIMTKILPAFPSVIMHFNSLKKSAEALRDAERGKRDDLSLLAASYATQLKKRSQYMIPVEDFYNREKTENNTTPLTTTTEKSTRKRVVAAESEATPSKKLSTSKSKR